MPDYRLYFFDGAKHIRHALVLDCTDDSHAIATVAEHADGRAMELWWRDRMVKAFPKQDGGEP
jgi:hypothetical protein